jgi:hypothetical protein
VRNYRPHPSYWLPVNKVWLDLPKRRIDQLAQALTSPWGALAALAHGGAR